MIQSKKKVLWFTNTPSLASKHLGDKSYLGGWISSLEKEIAKIPEIELAIAFPYNDPTLDDFKIESTRYYPFPQVLDGGIIKGFLSRWRHSIGLENDLSFFKAIVAKFKPDLIHVFGSERSFGLMIYETEMPLIIQIQGNLSVYEKKWFSGISLLDVLRYCRKKDLLLGYGVFHAYFLFRKRAKRERKILEECNYVIGRTDWDRRISRILAPQSTYFHCEEVLREQFREAQWSYKIKEKRVLVSTISPLIYKGLETVLEAANLLKKNSSFHFEWEIIGARGTEEIVEITERSTGLKFRENNVCFKGSLDSHKLLDRLVDADCYIHPSHIENSPNSICEAMIVGTPVIATFAGGTSTILKNGEEGVLVQNGDPYAMAGAIVELINSPEKMKSYSSRARQRAIVRHNPRSIVDTVLNIYQKVLERN